MKFLPLCLIASALCAVASRPATAQINPFRTTPNAPKLSPADSDMLLSSIDDLNRTPDLAVGAKSTWRNTATGSYGSNEVTRIFAAGDSTCHRLHHEVGARGRKPPRPYDITWCLTPQGAWQIKG